MTNGFYECCYFFPSLTLHVKVGITYHFFFHSMHFVDESQSNKRGIHFFLSFIYYNLYRITHCFTLA